MFIIDDETNKKLETITIALSINEIKQLLGYAKQLLEGPADVHCHLSSEDYQKEITLCKYDSTHLDHFNDRIKKLILDDE